MTNDIPHPLLPLPKYMSVYPQAGPPMYRHPPPVPARSSRDMDEDTTNETVLSATSLTGAPVAQYYNPACDSLVWAQAGPPYSQYMLAPSFPATARQPSFDSQRQPSFEQHTKVGQTETCNLCRSSQVPVTIPAVCSCFFSSTLSDSIYCRTVLVVGVIVVTMDSVYSGDRNIT